MNAASLMSGHGPSWRATPSTVFPTGPDELIAPSLQGGLSCLGALRPASHSPAASRSHALRSEIGQRNDMWNSYVIIGGLVGLLPLPQRSLLANGCRKPRPTKPIHHLDA